MVDVIQENDWFTVEAIDDETFAVSEYAHWEEPHCYLICGKTSAVLIDSGLGVCGLLPTVRRLTPLPVTVLLTHAHWDHIGGLANFARFAVHEAERAWLCEKFPLPPQAVRQELTRNAAVFPENFDCRRYQAYRGTPAVVLRDGMKFDLGGRTIETLHTPGHSPGHCCFYDADRQYLFAGDLLYKGCLDAYYPSTDPLQFYASVRRVARLRTKKILPGHHALRVEKDFARRVEAAFEGLSRKNLLKQGGGVFSFDGFQIHL